MIPGRRLTAVHGGPNLVDGWLTVIGCGVAMLAIPCVTLLFYCNLFRDEIDEVMEGKETPAPTRCDPGES